MMKSHNVSYLVARNESEDVRVIDAKGWKSVNLS